MAQTEQQENAKAFAENWKGKGDEKQETSRFWMQLLGEVLDVKSPASYIEFEKKVKLSHTSFIDAYIPETKVLIEQKGIKIDLNKAYEQSDGTVLTPYQQAKRYADEMPYNIRPRWIVVSNFAEIHVHDMNKPSEKPEIIYLKDLEKDYYRLEFLVDRKNENIRREEEISLAAGKLVGKLYDALIKEYINPDAPESSRSLNILCVRLVFCFYAEDAGLFETRTSFEDYIKSFAVENVRVGLISLFKALDTKLDSRDKYDTKLKPFPYVNGGLFHDENIEIPNFTQEIVDVLVNDCAPFNWSEISPTIFGAVFESTLNPETRRKGGMHYTSIENIHKVIDPLFLDDLNAEFDEIMGVVIEQKNAVIEPVEMTIKSGFDVAQPPKPKNLSAKQRAAALYAFQEKLGKLTFLDPACGSGNFLTETYLSLRRLENKVISALNKGEKVLGFDEFIKVKINQFYGIEINDFAVTVAKTALWIAESQMINETEKIISQQIDFLPLTTNAFIVEGNALRMDWATLKPLDGNEMPEDGLFAGITTHVDGSEHRYDYIMGNPPFIGKKEQKDKKEELVALFPKEIKGVGNLDYVSGWYVKAIELIKGSDTTCAFVSTNSITQGEQVPVLWKYLVQKGLSINFAYRTFRWDSESTEIAHVHCVIIGFSDKEHSKKQKFIITENGERKKVGHINDYLIDAGDIYVESRNKPICPVAEIVYGSMPIDDNHLILSKEEADKIIAENPANEKFVRKYVGGEEIIKNKVRYCLWLKDASPKEMRSSKLISERIKETKEFRQKSTRPQTVKLAETPWLFGEIRQPETQMLVIPKVSSERRKYIPIAFVQPETIVNGSALIVPKATLYEFGILMSNVHNDWMRAVAGRLETRYQYSGTVVYNNFPWCSPTDEQKVKIEKTAQAILDARAKTPDSSLADLYDDDFMPPELRKAHEANDRAVMQAYGFDTKMTEAEVVAELFKMYEKLANIK